MKVAAAPRLWGTTIFCDDLRQEAQGTISIIGAYTSSMMLNVESFPVMVPKFSLFIRIFEKFDDFLTKDSTLKVFFPGDEEKASYEQTLAFSLRKNAQIKLPLGEQPSGVDKAITSLVPLVFSPVQFASEGVVKVRLYCEDMEYRLGALGVHKGQVNLAASTASPPPSSQSPSAAPAS